jgi:hypothetical protein
MRLQRRVARLEQLLPATQALMPDDPLREKRLQFVSQRMDRLVARAEELMSAAEREQVRLASEQLRDNFDGPYGDWLSHLREGMCRLPDVSPAAMKDLLLAWLKPEADRGMVCNQCGLEYPQHRSPPLSEYRLLPGKTPFEGPPPWYDMPRLFPACPGCGASCNDTDWPHRTWECHRSWKDIDGFVGEEKVEALSAAGAT